MTISREFYYHVKEIFPTVRIGPLFYHGRELPKQLSVFDMQSVSGSVYIVNEKGMYVFICSTLEEANSLIQYVQQTAILWM